MEIYRIEKEGTPLWLFKAYDYVRTDAFVFGQNIPIEVEFNDEEAKEEIEGIVIVEQHKPIAGCRITYPKDNIAKIGRVCVIREKQRTGVGHLLIEAAEKWILERGFSHIVINSQDRAQAFYERCGYHLVPGVDPEIYEKHGKREERKDTDNQKENKKDDLKIDLGFRCVLVEKKLGKEQ